MSICPNTRCISQSPTSVTALLVVDPTIRELVQVATTLEQMVSLSLPVLRSSPRTLPSRPLETRASALGNTFN